MRNLKLWLFAVMFAAALTVGMSAYADNITVWDGDGTGLGPDLENGETEPGTVNKQEWDLEAVLWNDGSLTLVGGWNFLTEISNIGSGDLFIASGTAPNRTVPGALGNWGYDFVFDTNYAGAFEDNAGDIFVPYQLINISGGANLSLPSVWLNKPESSPVAYISGGQTVGHTEYAEFQKFSSDQALLDAFPFEFADYTNTGGTHYSLTFNGVKLPTGETSWTHFTQGCGNDNLMGQVDIPPVPEPATMGLLSLGLLGMFARRKHFN